jgi:hypothetical protein
MVWIKVSFTAWDASAKEKEDELANRASPQRGDVQPQDNGSQAIQLSTPKVPGCGLRQPASLVHATIQLRLFLCVLRALCGEALN